MCARRVRGNPFGRCLYSKRDADSSAQIVVDSSLAGALQHTTDGSFSLLFCIRNVKKKKDEKRFRKLYVMGKKTVRIGCCRRNRSLRACKLAKQSKVLFSHQLIYLRNEASYDSFLFFSLQICLDDQLGSSSMRGYARDGVDAMESFTNMGPMEVIIENRSRLRDQTGHL